MHPAVRLVLFLLFTATLAADRQALYPLLSGLVIGALLLRYAEISAAARSAWRLRWFFLSLLALGVGFPPEAGDSWAGLAFSLRHIGVLLLVLLGAHLLLRATPLPELIAALDWLLSPLSRLGLPTRRFSVRLVLILDTVKDMQRAYGHLPEPFVPPRGPLERIGDKAAALFMHALHRGETSPLLELELPEARPPPLWQWLYPGALLGAHWLLARAPV